MPTFGTHDLAEQLFQFLILFIAAETLTDRRIEPIEPASAFVVRPSLQLIANLRGIAGNESGTARFDQLRRDPALIPDEENGTAHVEVFEELGRKIAFVPFIARLEQQEHVRLSLQLESSAVGHETVGRDRIANAVCRCRLQNTSPVSQKNSTLRALRRWSGSRPMAAKSGEGSLKPGYIE